MGIVLLIAALGDSPNYDLWSVIAVIGILAATVLVYAGRTFEYRELYGGVYKKWERDGEMKE